MAVDINPKCSDFLNSDVDFINNSILNITSIMPHTIDFIFISNVLEHFSSKAAIEEFLIMVNKILKPNGKLCIIQPNYRYCYKEYWDYWDHHIPISDKSMLEVLNLFNFDIDLQIARFLPYTVKNYFRVPALFLKFYLGLPILWKIFGQQFFILASKGPNE